MRIFNFKQFESYLGSGRHLLYHTMRSKEYFKMVFETDTMKPGLVSRGPKGICFSRSINWTNQGDNNYRIVLDSDLLRRDGYKIFPLQELSYKSRGSTEYNNIGLKGKNVWKGNLMNGKRMPPHNININGFPKKPIMETEFEERILEPITNVGKYIIYIDLYINKEFNYILPNSYTYPPREIKNQLVDVLRSYIVKYPHIKVRTMDSQKSHKVKEVDLSTISVDKEKVKI